VVKVAVDSADDMAVEAFVEIVVDTPHSQRRVMVVLFLLWESSPKLWLGVPLGPPFRVAFPC
jgi:hypothetical protein